MMEFQAIVLAGGEGLRLFPLCTAGAGTPKALLPIANRPMIYHQLLLLEKAGFSDVLIVTTKSCSKPIATYVAEYYKGTLAIEVEVVKDDSDTLDALRKIKDKIHSDFLVISCDLITDAPLTELLDLHRMHDATVTMLLKHNPVDTTESIKAKDELNFSDYIGLGSDARHRERVLYFNSDDAMDSDFIINTEWKKRRPDMVISTELLDAHCYTFSRSVLDLTSNEKKDFCSIKYELLPYIVNKKQFTESHDKTNENIVYKMSSSISTPAEKDVFKCYAHVLPRDKYCARVTTTSSYLTINSEIAANHVPLFEPVNFPLSTEHRVQVSRGDTLIGEGFQAGDRVRIQKSVLGKHVKLGNNVHIINSILMDHITVDDNCKIQNSVISSDCHIKKQTNLKDSQVGYSFTVPSGDYKNESLCKERD